LTEIEHLDRGPGATLIIDSYGGLSLHEQSHGESFLALMTHCFGGHGLYLLDESEAALSPQRQLIVLVRMNDLVKASSQFIIATHSPILLAYPEATIYGFGPGGIREMAYEETEHYQVMRNFLQNPRRMMEVLFAELCGFQSACNVVSARARSERSNSDFSSSGLPKRWIVRLDSLTR
jgi:predicted ATPase